MSYKFRFDEKKCTGCFACHTACLDAHYGPGEEGISLRSIKRIVVESKSFQKDVCPGCIHCGACARACPRGALLADGDTGLVLARRALCSGCRACESACPVQVIRFDREGKIVKCDGCLTRLKAGREPACVRACPTGAVTVEEERESDERETDG